MVASNQKQQQQQNIGITDHRVVCDIRNCYQPVTRHMARAQTPTSSITLDNDPSAGSPTETLLRLLLPLDKLV